MFYIQFVLFFWVYEREPQERFACWPPYTYYPTTLAHSFSNHTFIPRLYRQQTVQKTALKGARNPLLCSLQKTSHPFMLSCFFFGQFWWPLSHSAPFMVGCV